MAVAIAFKVAGSNGNLTQNGNVTVTGLTTSVASLITIGVCCGFNTANTVASVTVNGNAATQRKAQLLPDGTSRTEVWTFWSASALASVSVVATFTTSSSGAGTNVVVCEATGTDTNSPGNTGGANGTSGSSAASATCSATGSVMFGYSLNFGGPETAGTNTTLLRAQNDGAGDDSAASNNTQSTTSGNSYTVTTSHTSGDWAMAVLEVKPAAGPTSLLPDQSPRMPMAMLAQ